MATVLEEIFGHNVWANLRLIDACAALSGDDLDATAPGTYGSIMATLNHIVRSEERYLETVTGQPPATPAGDADPSLADLRERARRSGGGLVAVAANPPDHQILEGIWRGEPFSMPAAIPLVQAINHATDHRSQIATILSQHGITPPDLDGWSYDEDPGRR